MGYGDTLSYKINLYNHYTYLIQDFSSEISNGTHSNFANLDSNISASTSYVIGASLNSFKSKLYYLPDSLSASNNFDLGNGFRVQINGSAYIENASSFVNNKTAKVTVTIPKLAYKYIDFKLLSGSSTLKTYTIYIYSLALGLDNIKTSDTRDVYTSLFYVTSSINIMIKNLSYLYQSEVGMKVTT